MKAIAKTLAAALVGMAMAGAPILAQTVTIDYDHTVNFLKFKTYTWEKIHASDPDVESRITLAMKRDMTGRYMTEVGKGGDVTLTAVEATQDKQEFTTFYKDLGDYAWQRPWGSAGFYGYAGHVGRHSTEYHWLWICMTPIPISCSGAALWLSRRAVPGTRKTS